MGREGWIYALAFLAILGVGALIIVPRLDPARPPPTADPYRPPEAGPEAPPSEEGAAVREFAGRPEYDWTEVTVTGSAGGLRGPLRPVHGADVEALTPPEAGVHVLRVRPRAAQVAFGAAGHQWVTRGAAGLAAAPRVELPDAAPAVVVRVREPDGRPAAGVPVRVEPAPPGEVPRTDDGGTVVLDHLPPGLVLLDLATDVRRGPRLRLRAGEDRDVRVVLEPAWVVAGQVLDPEGAPLAGAEVTGFGPGGPLGSTPTTDAEGRFAWRGPAVVRLSLHVRARGWGELAVEAAPPALGALHTDLGPIRLEGAGVTVRGVVHAPFREPDAHVEVEPAVAAVVREVFGAGCALDRPRRVPLDADGRFELGDLPADLPLRVAARGAGVPMDAIVRGGAGAVLTVELEAVAGESLAGRLRLPDGRPAAGVRLLLSREPRDGDRPLPDDVEVVAGADGSFHKRGLVGRTWFLRAYASGARSLLRRVQLPLAQPLELTCEAPLADAERRVEGRLFDGLRTAVRTAPGEPIVGRDAEILYGAALAGVSVRAAGRLGVTDAEGRFRLEGVESLAPAVGLAWGYEAGPLPAGAPDPRPFLGADALDVTPGGRPLDLVLPRAATLRFTAHDAVTDAPLCFVHVVVRTDQGRLVFDRGVAPVDGRVEIPGLPPRGVELTVLAPGRRFQRAPVPLEPGEVQDLGVVLLGGGMRIEGRVLDPDGRPVPDARIGAYGRGWQHAGQDPAAERELLLRTTRADGEGRFVLEGFDPRRAADLAVWAPGWPPVAKRVELKKFSDVVLATPEVKLVAGIWLALDLRAPAAGAERGAAVHGAVLDLQYAYGATNYLDLVRRGMLGGVVGSTRAWRDASQHLLYEDRGDPGYVVGPLRPGPYDLWVERPGYEPLRRKLTAIDPREAWRVDLASGREVHGTVMRLQFDLQASPGSR